MKKRVRVSIAVAGIAALCLILSACPTDAVKNASEAVNKYANTLNAFQDAEIKLHDAGKVSDAQHRTILHAEIVASKAGHDLDAGIAVAAKGGDPSQYINVAKQAFGDLTSAVGLDANVQASLNLVVGTASDALQNAITLINAIKDNPPPAKPSPSGGSGSGLAVWLLALGLFPMLAVAGGIDLGQIVTLLQIIVQLEPIGFDLIMKLAQNMKGKTTEEILAMNESIFSKVEQTAQDELNKLDQKS